MMYEKYQEALANGNDQTMAMMKLEQSLTCLQSVWQRAQYCFQIEEYCKEIITKQEGIAKINTESNNLAPGRCDPFSAK